MRGVEKGVRREDNNEESGREAVGMVGRAAMADWARGRWWRQAAVCACHKAV